MSIVNKSINQGKYQLILSVTFFGTPCVYCYFFFATQVEQTPGRLLRHSGEQGDEVDRGQQKEDNFSKKDHELL